jgi:hypothetical protein
MLARDPEMNLACENLRHGWRLSVGALAMLSSQRYIYKNIASQIREHLPALSDKEYASLDRGDDCHAHWAVKRAHPTAACADIRTICDDREIDKTYAVQRIAGCDQSHGMFWPVARRLSIPRA